MAVNERQLGIDLSVILGATLGAMLRSGQTADEIREEVESALRLGEALQR
jgi:hypothetical protein